MFTKIRNRVEGDRGFTLIELLVVILIIGILAAIAIPSFLNQREKGQDACAKSMARTMQTAMETFYTDNNDYNATTLQLSGIENQITTTAPCGGTTTIGLGTAANNGTCQGTLGVGATAYAVCANSRASGGGSIHTFSVARDANGAITRSCGPALNGGCLAANTW